MIDDIYEVKLIGKTYEIDKDILIKIPFFKTMIHDFSENKSKVISVKRSSLLFDHVIAYIIDDTYPYPLKYFNELDFYDIVYDKSKLYNPHKNSNDKLESLSKNTTEIHNLLVKSYELTNKIYELDSKIENITGNITYDNMYNKKCTYPNCDYISGYDKFCIEHKKLFEDKCGYKDPKSNKFCIHYTHEKSKYCLECSEYGNFCNEKYCRKAKINKSKFCVIHS